MVATSLDQLGRPRPLDGKQSGWVGPGPADSDHTVTAHRFGEARRCPSKCQLFDASPWYGGGLSIHCGGRDAETLHLYEGFSYTYPGNQPPLSVTV
jgi:hypothetical protein